MAQLDVYANPDRDSARLIPYVVEIQSDLLKDLSSAMVIPLAATDLIDNQPILRLNPRIDVEGLSLIALTQEMATVPRRMLRNPVTHLADQRDALIAALDLLFTGF